MLTLLLINPAAGHGRADRLGAVAEAAAARTWGEVRALRTGAAGEATELVRRAVEEGVTRVLVLGGDGTIQEAANGLLKARVAERPPIGILPAGTGNDFAKLTGTVHLRPDEAVARLANGTVRRLDVGMAWEECFLNSVGIGFDAEVARRIAGYRHGRGLPAYLLAVFQELAGRKVAELEIESSVATFTDQLLLLEIGNGPIVGGGFRITPNAKPDDGQLDVCAIQDMPIPALLMRLPLVMAGRHLGLSQVRHFRTDRLVVRSRSGPIQAQFDGELRNRSDTMEIRILPGALPVLTAAAA